MDIFKKRQQKSEQELLIEDLVKKAQAGNTEAFADIYDKFVDKIYKYLFFKVGKEEALDLTETVFLKAWEYITHYRFKPGSGFSSWIFRIAHNLAVDYFKRKKESLPLNIDVPDSKQDNDPRYLMEQKLSEQKLKSALNLLKKNYREVLTLSYLNDMNNIEIAEIMGKNEVGLRVLKHRALKELKRVLKEMGVKY